MTQVTFLEIPVQGQRVSFSLQNGQRGVTSPVSSVSMMADGSYSVITTSGSVYVGHFGANNQTVISNPMSYPSPPAAAYYAPQPVYQSSPQPYSSATGGRQRSIAIILALLLGGVGVHKIYLGEMMIGILYFVFSWTLIPGLIALFDMINYACMSDADFNSRYN